MKVIKQSKRNVISQYFHAENDKEKLSSGGWTSAGSFKPSMYVPSLPYVAFQTCGVRQSLRYRCRTNSRPVDVQFLTSSTGTVDGFLEHHPHPPLYATGDFTYTPNVYVIVERAPFPYPHQVSEGVCVYLSKLTVFECLFLKIYREDDPVIASNMCRDKEARDRKSVV